MKQQMLIFKMLFLAAVCAAGEDVRALINSKGWSDGDYIITFAGDGDSQTVEGDLKG
ncbi:MAG: hypothetical protein LBS12_02500 [Prevotellaceae bacterium]|jgi:hypothetical protein|nr:hypothetical protein [Prevotellaceae bacterium]